MRKSDLSDEPSNVLATFYRGRVIFKHYIHKKYKHFGISVYRLCQWLTYDVSISLERMGKMIEHRQRQTYWAVVKHFTRKAEGI